MNIEDLMKEIGTQLNIRGIGTKWKCRLIYSLTGRMALASLWDREETTSSVSIQHMKKRMKQILEAYNQMNPECPSVFGNEWDEIIDEIYTCYLRSGTLYHRANRVSPSPIYTCGNAPIYLQRGILPYASCFMSGLGLYTLGERHEEGFMDINDVFGLQKQSFDSYLQELLEEGEWKSVDWPEGTEFLVHSNFPKGYWQSYPNKDGRISLARYGKPNPRYVFYQYKRDQWLQKSIPEWRTRAFLSNDEGYGEYRRIAISLLMRYHTFPSIKAERKGTYIDIHLGYKLPPAEEEFFKLYSWPVYFSEIRQQSFHREMAIPVYQIWKAELEKIGYCFEEETHDNWSKCSTS